jgi:protein MpaA
MYLVLGQGPDTTFIMATIHGNEAAGTPLVRRLNEYLQQNPGILFDRTVVLLPVANPDGLANGTRFNVHNVDLNRNFIAANRRGDVQGGSEALSEPEARAIYQIIRQYGPDRIVSIHQPLACIDYDGPGRQIADHMAQYCDLPVKKLGARPGSLGSYAGVTLSIPIITFEMQKHDSTLDTQILWQRYGKALLAAITFSNQTE